MLHVRLVWPISKTLSASLHMSAALYRSVLDEDEDVVGDEDSEQDVLHLPDLLFRRPPQLLHYTAALRRPYDDDTHDFRSTYTHGREQREELNAISKTSEKNSRKTSHLCILLDLTGTHSWTIYIKFLCVLVCEVGSFGEDCNVTCEDCANGGVCSVENDRCVCPAGWTGIICNESECFINDLWPTLM